jgi:hypothetical protein
MHAPRAALPAAALVLAATVCLTLGTGAHAGGAKGTGPSGQILTVSQADGLSAEGATIRVTGTGFDTGKGVYVALCKDNGAGKTPSPCGGGADASGATGSSQWISSNPPPYGESLAVPYGPGGTFTVTLRVGPAIAGSVDCTEVRCAVVTRADHTRASDRSQDVRVPVAFDDGGGMPGWAWAALAAGAAAIVAGAVAVLTRRRRAGSAEAAS